MGGQFFPGGLHLKMARFMKVTFVQTANRLFSDTQMFGVHFMPVWAYTLAAHLRSFPGITLRLFDDRFDDGDTVEASDVFFFTGINQDYDAIVRQAAALRDRFRGARLVIGGPICWSYKMAGKIEALYMFDHIVIGDGEEMAGHLIGSIIADQPAPKVIEAPQRFDLSRALPMDEALLRETISRYYGGVLEVSRGCPFLCEFCDIRVLPDNNRAHVKLPALIVKELDRLFDLGVRQCLFACDNFIGNPVWADTVCDAIIEWRRNTGKKLSLYTWLTVNLSRTPRLMRKLREAGFDMFFVGVESFHQTSLLETAKVQNTTHDLVQALRDIQSYGFIVVAGLIFGFDTDPDDIASIALDGILKSGLISGDPSLLTALPGTPLYQRMALSGRLRNAKLGLGGFKYQTNIRYVKPAPQIRQDFKTFVHRFNQGGYQYGRLMSFLQCLNSKNYVAPQTAGYADLGKMFRMILREPRYVKLMLFRLLRLTRSPIRDYYIVKAIGTTFLKSSSKRPLWFYLKIWLFTWSNSLLKYADLSDADFDIESVHEEFGIANIVPAGYEEGCFEQIPASKIRSQRQLTASALQSWVEARSRRE
jgi:radical SAM superfamily enzyme YgiQ (UPF0313 family)